jgi:hypothetical protein
MNKIFLEIDQETYNFLMQLSHEMNTQDNLATAPPYGYIVVYDEDRVCQEGDEEKLIYYDGCDDYEEEDLYVMYAEFVHEALDTNNEVFSFDDWLALKFREIPVKEEKEVCHWANVNYFLTRKAFDQHMQTNKHNLPRNSRPFLIHNYRNHEMERLQEFLRNLTKNKHETPRFDVNEKGENDG